MAQVVAEDIETENPKFDAPQQAAPAVNVVGKDGNDDDDDDTLRGRIEDFGQETLTKAKTWWNYWGEFNVITEVEDCSRPFLPPPLS